RIELDASAPGVGVMSPDPRVAIRLELHPNRERIARIRIRALQLAELALGAGQRLDVMSELVREDVGLSEIAWRSELAIELVEKAEIEIDLAIAGTVEGPGRGLREPACRVNGVAKEHR